MRRSGVLSLLCVICLSILNSAPTVLAQSARSPLLDSFEEYLAIRDASEFRLEWVPLGPVMNSARVEAVQGDPRSPATMYAAFGSGNLWKTTDHGLTWRPIFEDQSALGIGDIALAPSNPDVIWLGSGESLKKARNFTMPGTGVFRSDDAGETWRNVGLPDSYHIGEIAVHPGDPDIAFVAVQGHFWSTNPNRGLYRTVDGGESWEHVLYVNERTGANDVVIAPSDPDRVYVSMWENNPGVAGPESGVWYSADGGATFTRARDGFPDGDMTGRIGVAVSWTDPLKAYAFVDNLNRTGRQEGKGEVYRTLDGGVTWNRTHEEELLNLAGLGWYFVDCHVNPRDDDEIWALGVQTAHSADGGKTFSLMGGEVYHLFPNPAEMLQSRPSPPGQRRRLLRQLRPGGNVDALQQHPGRGVLRHRGRQPVSLPGLRRNPGRLFRHGPLPGVAGEVPRRLAVRLARLMVGRRRLLYPARSDRSEYRLLLEPERRNPPQGHGG